MRVCARAYVCMYVRVCFCLKTSTEYLIMQTDE